MISETKLDESFPIGHFFIKGFRTPFLLDRNSPEVVFICISEIGYLRNFYL